MTLVERREVSGRRTHADAALATRRAIVILERADDLIVGVRDREGAGEGRARRHVELSSCRAPWRSGGRWRGQGRGERGAGRVQWQLVVARRDICRSSSEALVGGIVVGCGCC